MKSVFRKNPFFPIAVALILGIATSELMGNTFSLPVILFLFGGTVAANIYLVNTLRGQGTAHIHSLILLISVYLLGVFQHLSKKREWRDDHYSHIWNQTEWVVTTVEEVSNHRYYLKIRQVGNEVVTGKALWYDEAQYRPGCQLVIRGRIKKVDPPKSPYVFDFQKYLKHKHIEFQVFDDSVFVQDDGKNLWSTFFADLRSRCQSKLKTALPTKEEFALANALVLGDRTHVDPNLRDAFADTGTMHIMAVSGLHVGAIYLLLMLLLKYFPVKWTVVRVVKSIVIIGVLWFFVALVGMPISAWRAAFMFSLFELGALTSRKQYSINTLSIAAFFLLLLDAYALFDVGFQLSFLAVLGIVTTQHKMEAWWKPGNVLVRKIWSLVSLSFAAQIYTFPIVMYYFHQLSGYFWLSGVLAVPLAGFLLGSSLLYLIWSFIPMLSTLLGYLVFGFAFSINSIVHAIHKLPGVVIEHIWLAKSAVLIFSIAFIGLGIYINIRNRLALKYALLCFLAGFLIQTFQSIKHHRQILLVAHHSWTENWVDLIVGNRVYPLFEGKESSNPHPLITQSRAALRATIKEEISECENIYYERGTLVVNDKVILCDNSAYYKGTNSDFVLISRSDPDFQRKNFSAESKVVILPEARRSIQGQMVSNSDQWHDVRRQGSFIYRLN